MIKQIGIKGFKCFDNERFNLAPLTLLSGLNSSGKSTFLQAIKLAYGFGESSRTDSGPLSELISVLHKSFEITIRSDKKQVTFAYPNGHRNYDPSSRPDLFSHVAADRLGPQIHLPIRLDDAKGKNVGEKGEFVLDFLEHHFELAGLPDTLRREDAKSHGVFNNIKSWLSIISPGIEFKWESIPKADLIRPEYSGHRPSNVGFGVSYTLPIIANALVYAALLAKDNNKSALILLENPEAHLHPAGQTALGIFLARVAACGVQLIIETHSDHLLNGIRIAVKNGNLCHDDSVFYYFQYDFDEEKSIVNQPVIDEYGYFDEWPDGFFDETEKNLERLL